MDRLEALQVFVRVVEAGSLTKAAGALGIVQPTVSKHIATLEDRLGARLLNRTSRGLSLTAAGQDYYESAIRLIAEFEEAEARIGRGQATPAGMVRVASSAGLGRMYLLPRLPEFFARYPDVSIDIDVSERFISLIEDGIDVAIRIGHLADSTLVARRIGSIAFTTVATQGYLARCGEPKTPAALAGHDCVGFVHRGALLHWNFVGPAGQISIEPKARVRANDAEHIRAAVIAGIGIGHNPIWLYAPELGSGELREVLSGYAPHPVPIHAVCPGGRRIPSRVRVFIDFLAELCASDPHLRIR
ncbi:MAG: LysR family transcriptional regulator [Rhodospirillales bacterium]|nr:LysR family transcriptional regulator [Rhodospirillales bacterium]